jgi:adenylate cyclase
MSKPVPTTRRGRRLPLLRWFRRSRVLILLIFAGLVFGFMALPWAKRIPAFHDFFQKIEKAENGSLDLRFRWRGAQPPHPGIVVLGISQPFVVPAEVRPDDLAKSDALRAMGEKEFPWRRQVWVEVLEKLFASGARVVAFDIVFATKNQDDPAFISTLAKYADRIVLAMTVQNTSPDPSTKNMQVFYPASALLDVFKGRAVGCAVVHQETDDDETIRRVDHYTSELRELGFPDDSAELPSLSSLAVEKFTGKPVGAGQGQLIRYQGGRQTYRYLPVHYLFQLSVDGKPLLNSDELFRDKLVFIGATYELAHDDKMTPFGMMAGVEVHAQAAADLLTGARLRDVAPRTGWLLTLVTTFGAVAAVGVFRRAWLQALTLLLLAIGYVAFSYIAFRSFDRVFPMMAPLIGLGVTGAFGVFVSFAVEQWEKAQTRKVLDRSVNKRIAKVMMRNAEGFDQVRRGERRLVAILFSDIRSFTTWSEKAEPENLVGQLNEYFERMVELVERDDSLGNAQKFIGDAILAAWGDTPENQFGDAEDSRRAIAVALQMRVALRELNTRWTGRDDRIVISIGMGINLGDVVVGEVGHPERREYTVLGDGVNFAARLESATKQFHTDCLVGEKAEAVTRDKFVYRHVDYVRVKGKTKPVNIYIPLSDRSVPAPEWLDDYHRARELYVGRKFGEAAVLFREVLARMGGEDYLCTMYAERCDQYAKEPPPADWDGSYTMTEK